MEAIIFDRVSGDNRTTRSNPQVANSIRSDRSFDSRISFDRQYTAADELRYWWGHSVSDEPPSSTVQPSGKPISLSHSLQVKFLAT